MSSAYYWFECSIKDDSMTVEGNELGSRGFLAYQDTGDGDGDLDSFSDFIYGDGGGDGYGSGECRVNGDGGGGGDGSGRECGYGL